MRCSALAEQLDEPMAGSVDQRHRWLLVEDRSAWGAKAVRDVLGAELEARAKAAAIRPLLIRRREGDPAADALRRVFVADVESGALAMRTITDLAELDPLLALPIDQVGERVAGPMFLVCTNGKRDACCALRGRALMASLGDESTWECTHLGGHRFAGNLVCLPDGLVYGRVTADDGPRLAAAYREGRVDPALLRGRSAWPAPAQVAEVSLRSRLRIDGVQDVALVRADVDGVRATIELRAPDGLHRLSLVAEREVPPRPISCRADELEQPMHWRVV
jgi:hypothetical protein